jgi:hypothetical protein
VSEQPEALRLADALEASVVYGYDDTAAAAELRRQHAEIERLRDAGVGYSQQTMDAVVREREKLREANAEMLAVLNEIMSWEENEQALWAKKARAAIAKATGEDDV